MKKLLFIFMLCSPLISSAQNWKSVRMNDTTYYTIPAADDYLRVIWIDSAKSIGADSIYYFYPSIRLGNTTTNCLDTLGPTWLGKNFIKKSNGDELFFNRWLDTIVMKPNTLLNNSWLLHTDTANNTYWATVTVTDTMTIDNQLDSIKEVNIEVYNGSTLVTSHIHNNRKMILSKNHGFVECVEWYGFPNYSSGNDDLIEIFNETHVKQPKSLNNYKPFRQNPARIYRLGNEWHYKQFVGAKSGAYHQNWKDSIISSQMVGTDSVLVKFSHSFYSHWTYMDSFNVFKDSFTKYTAQKVEKKYLGPNHTMLESVLPEFYNLAPIVYSKNHFLGGFSSYYLSNYDTCGFDYKLRSANLNIGSGFYYTATMCPQMFASLSGHSIYDIKLISNFLQSLNYEDTHGGNSERFTRKTELLYYKLNGCSAGTPLDFISLSQSNVVAPTLNVFPNPASDLLYVSSSSDTKIQSLTLFSLDGKQVSKAKNKNELAIQEISNGLYILIAETNKGTIRKKIVIQH